MLQLKLLICLVLPYCIFSHFLVPSVAAEEALTLQIHPYLPASELVKRFAPLSEYLSEKLQRKIVCNISRNYREHIDMIGKDRVDIAFLGPASYITVVKKYGKKPLLARLEINGSPQFQGVIFTRTDSSIKTLNDLKGKSFAFGDIHSTMSHYVPYYMLLNKGIKKDDLSKHDFLNSHQNVALGVLMGDFDAGAVKEEVFYQYKERGIRDLVWSPKISEHLFVTRASFPEDEINTIRSAMLELRNQSNAKPIMTAIKKGVTGFVPVRDENYDVLREILSYLGNIKTQ